jgi:hypothetical protein
MTMQIRIAARVLALMTGILTITLGACTAGAGASTRSQPRRILVFWDMSRSTTTEEREKWANELHGLGTVLGRSLWREDEYDRIVIVPLHANTATAGPVVDVRFPGGQFNENGRRKALVRYRTQLDSLVHLTLDRSLLNETDILGSIDRIAEFRDHDTSPTSDGDTAGATVEVLYYSDMMHSVRAGLDFEARRPPFTRADAPDAARADVDRALWPAELLHGVTVNVRLPSTASGASVAAGDPDRIASVEAYWRSLFAELSVGVVAWGRF